MIVEVIEIIEILESVVVIIRSNAIKGSPVLKECQKKTLKIKSMSTRVIKMKAEITTQQEKYQRYVLSYQKFDDTMEELQKRLPEMEAAIVRQTPVSANYLILKQQHISHQV